MEPLKRHRLLRPRPLAVGLVLAVAAGLTVPVVNAGAAAAQGDISTIAGGGVGDGDPGPSAVLRSPLGVAVDGSGAVFIADTNDFRVRRIDARGLITTVAGNGIRAFSGDGGPATAASFVSPVAVAVDATGRVYVSDEGRIRRIDTNGIIWTVAGDGGQNPGGDGVAATSTSFVSPQGLAIDAGGALLIADQTYVSRVDTHGIVHIVAGGGTPADGLGDGGLATAAQINNPPGVTVNAAGDIYISDGSQRIRRIDHASNIITTVAGDGNFGFAGDGGPALQAEFAGPVGLAFDPSGGLLIADKNNERIRRIDAAGIVTTVAGSDLNGGFSGDGGPATAAVLSNPYGLAADTLGNFYFADAGNDRVRRVDTHAVITTIAGGGLGDGGPATSAALVAPAGVRAVADSLFITTRDSGNASGNRVRRVDQSGTVSTFAGGGSPADGLGDNGPARAAQLSSPLAVAATPRADTVFIADCGNNRVRKVNSQGVITTVAGGGAPADGVGDVGRAVDAALQCPTGLLLVTEGVRPPVGTLYIADCDANRVRRVDPSGMITTVAGTGDAGFNGDGQAAVATQLSCPSDLALDGSGRLLVADKNNNRVRRIEASGQVSTVAGDGAAGFGSDGGPATGAHVNRPTGLAIDNSGRLLIAEYSHARIRRVDTRGVITTVAGTGVPGFSGDGGPATLATLQNPTQVTLDHRGDIVFTDSGNLRVRQVTKGSSDFPNHGCGAVLTRDTTLRADLGPCSGDGLVIGADNINVDLGGHKVIGLGPGAGDGTHAGIRLTQHHGVTITNGTVTGFDAGVALIGASANTVSGLNVTNNVAPLSTATGFESSEFGDGIILMFSSTNRIVNNHVVANGIYDNIGVLGLGSDNNTIQGNQVSDSAGDGLQASPGVGVGISISPFLDLTLPDRGHSLHGNNILGNSVTGNYSAGISNLSNDDATIAHNVVTNNGLLNPNPGNGIGIRNTRLADPATGDVVDSNIVHGNGTSGIQVTSHQNRITNNDAANNAVVGRGFDLSDESFYRNPFRRNCTDNVWAGNLWGSGGFNQACVTAGGHPAIGASLSPSRAAALGPATAAGAEVAPPDQPTNQRHLSSSDLAISRAVAAG